MPTKRTIGVTVTRHPVGFTLHQDIYDEDDSGAVGYDKKRARRVLVSEEAAE